MQNKFLIFLDIDGVLYDWDFILSQNKKSGIIQTFNPKSVEALNYFIHKLSKDYNVEVVITSSWRKNMVKTLNVLKENKICADIKISSTKITSTPQFRGKEILAFLKNNPCKKFVIIDDETFDYHKYFNENQIIKTNIFNKSLNKEMINNYFDKTLNLEF